MRFLSNIENSTLISDELRSRVDRILAQDEPYPAPDVDGLPLSSKLNLFHADGKLRTSEIHVIIKHIFEKRQSLSTYMKWTDLKNKQNSLRELFVASSSAINENKASISRFRERIREKIIQKCKLEGQIKDLKFDIHRYNSVAANMEMYVLEYSKFEKFLESVAEVATEFLSVQDILNRYETLELTRQESTKRLEQEMFEAAELRKQMTSLVEERSAQLKSLSNKLVLMQVRRKMAVEQRHYWESAVAQLQSKLERGQHERIELQAGCRDLAVQMAQRSGLPFTIPQQDTEQQLDYIQKTIQFYKEVVMLATGVYHQRLNAKRNEDRRIVSAPASNT